jgi:transcriptional regulator with XRE-family HTH domain
VTDRRGTLNGMREMGRDLTIGERVAWWRVRRGLSQEVLAGLVGKTTDWLSKVENGRANLDRLSVIKSLADALDVTVGELLGEPSIVDWTPGTSPRTMTLLRESLMDYPALTGSLNDASPMPAEDLAAGIDQAWSAYQASRFGFVTTCVPRLLTGARAALSSAENEAAKRTANRHLALGYHVAAAALTKVGEGDLAWIASDRGLAAAEQADDAAVLASLLRSAAHSLMTNGRYGTAADVVSRATDRLDGMHRADPLWWSLMGSLHLVGAMAAARADQAAEARQFLARARQAGQQLGHDANHGWTAFGPTNVAVHEVSVAHELGDIQVALNLVPRVDARNLPVERRVRHDLEVARVYHQANRIDDAVGTILQAERESPEQVRYHYIARELVVTWMRARRSRARADVAGLARRLRLA